MTPGVRSYVALTADQAVAASTVLVILGANTAGNSFSAVLAAGAKALLHLHLRFSVGATGGLRVQIVLPAAPTLASVDILLADCVTPAMTPATQANNNVYTNALAVAGTHYLDLYCRVQNGVNAGTISAQAACNTAANTFTALNGTYMELTMVNS